jgi:hypothetical protein
VLSGAGTLAARDKTHVLSTGQLWLVPAVLGTHVIAGHNLKLMRVATRT